MGHEAVFLDGGSLPTASARRAVPFDDRVPRVDLGVVGVDEAIAEILDLLMSLSGAGRTVIVVTHDTDVARRAHRIIRMRDGRLAGDLAEARTPA